MSPTTQVPKLPAGGMKRKLPDNPTPEMLKKLKMEANTSSPLVSPLPGGSHKDGPFARRATVEEVEDEDSDFAPGGDADYFAEEDEEGRFFGGGLTSEQKEILNIFEKAEGDDIAEEVSTNQF